jgi:electron transport complex protein RnfG
MKQESSTRYILRITLVLLSIAVVVAGLLAVVNRVTAPVISAATKAKTQAAIEQVLPGGYETELTDFSDETGLVSKVYKGENGYALEVNPIGFDNTICMMVGVNAEGKVSGISIISHTESAGLGAVAASGNSAGRAFREQFVGASGAVSVNKDGGQIDAITNATITSRAVCDGVNAALACVAGLGGA